jgi:hypothetical protein
MQELPTFVTRRNKHATGCWWLQVLEPVRAQRHRRWVTLCVLCAAVMLGVLATFGLVRDLLAARLQNPSAHARGSEAAASSPLSQLKHLIIVAGNAVYTGSNFASASDDHQWYLEDYQKGQGLVFLQHIRRGIEIAQADPQALLLFSGGKTRLEAGPLSEAESYWRLASAQAWYGHAEGVSGRVLTEDFARDSFENLLFSICRFRQLTGHYPRNITMISLELKRKRIETQHRTAIRYPAAQFRFISTEEALHFGGPVPDSMPADRALAAFATDPYGCLHEELLEKRRKRNPFHVVIPYPSGCPEIARLIRYCGRNIFKGRLPWDP